MAGAMHVRLPESLGGGTDSGSADAVRLRDNPEAGDERLDSTAGETEPAKGENGDDARLLPRLFGVIDGMALTNRLSKALRNLHQILLIR